MFICLYVIKCYVFTSGGNDMKKLLLGLAVSMLLLAACGEDNTAKESANIKEEVDKNAQDVELTLPEILFDGQTTKEIEASAKKQGVKEVKINEDGTVYYKMSKSDHKQMMDKLKISLQESMDELVTNGVAPSFKKIQYNKDFTQFDVTVDRSAYENSMDVTKIFAFALSGTFYHAFQGGDMHDLKINVNMIDAATNKIFGVTVFPDDLEHVE